MTKPTDAVGQAELIVTNGQVLTMDQSQPRAAAVALAQGRIQAVGSAAEVMRLAGPGTRIIDAGGGTVLPGFIESHMHIFHGGIELGHLHLGQVKDMDGLRDAVSRFATLHPDRPFLLAQAASYSLLGGKPITRQHLDAILPDRPFAMMAADHHTMWANTLALKAAGLLQGRALGPGNEVVMGADGRASGELREAEAYGPMFEAAGEGRSVLGMTTGGEPDPAPTPAERALDQGILRDSLDWCARHGITSIHNMDGNLYQLQLLAEIERDGALKCRVQIPFHFKNFMPLDALDKAEAMRRDHAGDWLTSGMVKLFIDGVIDSGTALLVDPYADEPGHHGEPLFTAEHFAEVAVEADCRGLQIAVHACGDGGVRWVLDGYEAARAANGPRDSRHRVEHAEVITEADLPRFAELGVIASMQPLHAPGTFGAPMEPTLTRIGRERWPLAFAWRSLLQSGAHLALASDWPVVTVDPLQGIAAALARKPYAKGDPDHSLTLTEALRGYTVAGAHAQFMEDRKGALIPGYFGDVVVLSGDIEAAAPQDIAKLKVRTTICGGRITFSAEGEAV